MTMHQPLCCPPHRCRQKISQTAPYTLPTLPDVMIGHAGCQSLSKFGDPCTLSPEIQAVLTATSSGHVSQQVVLFHVRGSAFELPSAALSQKPQALLSPMFRPSSAPHQYECHLSLLSRRSYYSLDLCDLSLLDILYSAQVP